MSRKIDAEKIASGELTEDEERYLSDRNLLPEDYERKVEIKAPESSLGENTGDANTQKPQNPNIGEEPDEEEDEEDDEEEDESDDDEEEDYDEGWTNDSRRGELQKRGLSLEGNKDELIARLVADDKARQG